MLASRSRECCRRFFAQLTQGLGLCHPSWSAVSPYAGVPLRNTGGARLCWSKKGQLRPKAGPIPRVAISKSHVWQPSDDCGASTKYKGIAEICQFVLLISSDSCSGVDSWFRFGEYTSLVQSEMICLPLGRWSQFLRYLTSILCRRVYTTANIYLRVLLAIKIILPRNGAYEIGCECIKGRHKDSRHSRVTTSETD